MKEIKLTTDEILHILQWSDGLNRGVRHIDGFILKNKLEAMYNQKMLD